MNGQENTERNNVQNTVEVRLSEIQEIDEYDFDLLLANINRNILLEIAEDLVKRVKPGGEIILSGLLDTDEELIKESYLRFNLISTERDQLNEWVALVFIKQ